MVEEFVLNRTMTGINYHELMEQLDHQMQDVQLHFGSLNAGQLNYSPDGKMWSISQCLHHIIKTNEAYFPELRRASTATFKMTFWEKNSPFSRATGKNMVDQLGSEVKKKYSAPRLFQPDKKKSSFAPVLVFGTHISEFKSLIQAIEKHATDHANLTSPVAKLITLPIRDVLVMLTTHGKRHINQALRVKQSVDFPK
jgi:hypothetical protein